MLRCVCTDEVRVYVVGDLVCVWRLGRGILFWGWFVVMGTGQQKSEGGERKQE